MKKIAVFLDRDGTLNCDTPEGYTHRVEDFAFEGGAVDGLKRLRDLGFLLIIVTNQSGIGRGYYTEEQYQTFMDHMHEEFQREGITIDGTYYCPHYPKEGRRCRCRKPDTGMIEQALEDFDIDLENSYMIGDKTADGLLGNRMKCTSILVKCPTGKQGKDNGHHCEWGYIAKDVADAANWIEGHMHG